jgi:acetyl esterase/lipase
MYQRSLLISLLMIVFSGQNYAQVTWSELSQIPVPPPHKTITYGESEHHIIDVYLPQNVDIKSNIMLIHGGCWQNQYDRTYMGHMAQSLSERGYQVFNIEYHRTGDPGGGYPGTVQDIHKAYLYLQKYLTELSSRSSAINVIGHSAGGHLSLWLAATEPGVTTVVGLAAISDLSSYADGTGSCQIAARNFMQAQPAEAPEAYKKADPILMDIPRATLTLISTEKDAIVPPSHNATYVQRTGAKHHIFPEMGHFDLVAPTSGIWLSLLDLIEDSLR